ncbi:MAG: hypothetical protein ABI760_07380 [Ferruginibacter sp.]
MTKTIIFLLATVISTSAVGQTFEGKITYTNSFKSKTPNMKSEQFNKMMGTTLEYYIRNGDYKSVANGSLLQWQLYVNSENKLYTKMANSDTLIWNDGAVNADEVLKSELNKGAAEVLGYKCDELILTCKSGIQKYYFNSKLSVDAAVFIKHKYGNWYFFISKTNSLPLKIVIENEQFLLESTATTVTAVKLEKAFFDLPPNSKTIKSPY